MQDAVQCTKTEINRAAEQAKVAETIEMKDLLAQKRRESKLDSAEEMDAMWNRSLEFFEESLEEIAQ